MEEKATKEQLKFIDEMCGILSIKFDGTTKNEANDFIDKNKEKLIEVVVHFSKLLTEVSVKIAINKKIKELKG